MTNLTLDQAMALAAQHHRSGRLADAESIYRQILSIAPRHVKAMHCLGVLEGQNGRPIPGIDLLSRAIAIEPRVAAFHSDLGELYRKAGRLEEAIAQGQRAVALKPEYFEGHNNLGIALRDAGRMEEAIAAFRRAAELKSDSPFVHKNLGNALREAGQIDEAIQSYRRLTDLRPADGHAFNRLGVLQAMGGRLDEAMASFRRAIELDPKIAEAHNNLGNALFESGRPAEAVDFIQTAIQLKPRFAKAYLSLGVVQGLLGNPDASIEAYRRAIEIEPTVAEYHSNLGNMLLQVGRRDESIAAHRKAVELRPDSAGVHCNLIFALHCSWRDDGQAILEETGRFADRHERPQRASWPRHANDPDPDRKLRIGYLSGDFRFHPLANCMIPLLRHHDTNAVEVFCYANILHPDEITRRLRATGHNWRHVWARSNDALAGDIRDDRIDILVDLSLYTADNRLLVMVRKPAPVQATFLAYPAGSGLSAIDYRLTDAYLDPPDAREDPVFEKPFRLAHSYWCYDPLVDPIEIAAPPVLAAGYVKFGCLNKFSKISAQVLELWARILNRVEGSQLLLNAYTGNHRQDICGQFEKHGINSSRLEFVSRQTLNGYLRTYHRIDIALDSFPFCGGITSCDALWMGVPVVTLAGRAPISRGGCSILSNAGFPELIVESPDRYIEIAVELAGNHARLAEMRAGMRQRLQVSPLMDGKQYAADIETAFRTIWRTWCSQRK